MSNIDLNSALRAIKATNPEQGDAVEKWLKNYFFYLQNENANLETRIPNIKRGQVLLVDFGYNVLSEFRYIHYCIALHRSSRRNKKVTVIPITSKSHPHQIAIGDELREQIEEVVRNKERSSFWKPYNVLKPLLERKGIPFNIPAIGSYETVYPNCSSLISSIKEQLKNDDPLQVSLNGIVKSLEEFQEFLDQAPDLLRESYLRVGDITTISKARILSPKTSTHPLTLLRVTDKTLNKLDDEIRHRFTNSG